MEKRSKSRYSERVQRIEDRKAAARQKETALDIDKAHETALRAVKLGERAAKLVVKKVNKGDVSSYVIPRTRGKAVREEVSVGEGLSADTRVDHSVYHDTDDVLTAATNSVLRDRGEDIQVEVAAVGYKEANTGIGLYGPVSTSVPKNHYEVRPVVVDGHEVSDAPKAA